MTYVDTRAEFALNTFSEAFYGYLSEKLRTDSQLCILCIGTDRATGDSLGPLVGEKLAESTALSDGIYVYGTLQAPVHALNLCVTVGEIYGRHKNPLIVAVDAGLGHTERVGWLSTGHGALRPGAGLNKRLQPVGDIFITGIVNFSGVMEFYMLQNTRLGLVMRMADIVHGGILGAALMLGRGRMNSPYLKI
ncbi:MAG: spore protease YyaC [Defluviitaleaceae bacterium]|nr:spore protease YyaC [Defluviitaleaceae bacterium]